MRDVRGQVIVSIGPSYGRWLRLSDKLRFSLRFGCRSGLFIRIDDQRSDRQIGHRLGHHAAAHPAAGSIGAQHHVTRLAPAARA